MVCGWWAGKLQPRQGGGTTGCVLTPRCDDDVDRAVALQLQYVRK